MEEPHSVNSPRTILSFSKRGRTTTASVSFVDPNDEKSNSGEHGPKPSEVYGFVGSITTVVATDEFSREPSSFLSHMEGDEQPIEPISDLGIDKINVLMFDDAK
ncbi:hypothetical protein Gotri_013132 [Gossypium trilobum]|uniref:Uncharacterized protein n=2 Tax=Gossypium TaxID=3633 RepID=A0A7J9DSL0_9ROSI|nr:hypothetical protein [Gossypium laxum]MBA0763709.1 hypothetical protein [Gossypium trilobum]